MGNEFVNKNELEKFQFYLDKRLNAIQATGGAVTSFNGRAGAVVPTAGDYNAFYFTEAEIATLLLQQGTNPGVSLPSTTYAYQVAVENNIGGRIRVYQRNSTNSGWNLLLSTETASRTISIAHNRGSYQTSTTIQNALSGIGKYIRGSGTAITVQFSTDTARYFSNNAVVNKGGGLVGLPCPTNGFVAGERVRIDGTANYNGFYTVDATTSTNELVIAAPYLAGTLLTTGIARVPIQLTTSIFVTGHFGDGIIYFLGNASETGANTQHTTQQVVFEQTTAATPVFYEYGCMCPIIFQNLAIIGNTLNGGLQVTYSPAMWNMAKACFFYGVGTANAAGIQVYRGGYVDAQDNLFGKTAYGILSNQGGLVEVTNCAGVGSGYTLCGYGMYSNYGRIARTTGVIINGSTGPTGTGNGGTIT